MMHPLPQHRSHHSFCRQLRDPEAGFGPACAQDISRWPSARASACCAFRGFPFVPSNPRHSVEDLKAPNRGSLCCGTNGSTRVHSRETAAYRANLPTRSLRVAPSRRTLRRESRVDRQPQTSVTERPHARPRGETPQPGSPRKRPYSRWCSRPALVYRWCVRWFPGSLCSRVSRVTAEGIEEPKSTTTLVMREWSPASLRHSSMVPPNSRNETYMRRI